MIPVAPQPEPEDFDTKVRQPGLAWLAKHGIAPACPPPKASDLPVYWSRSNKQLWTAYSGVCAYLAIFVEWSTGASSTDHFIAKSRNAGAAYDWDNYRLSYLGPNRNKGRFDDVLDPFLLQANTFFINFSSGRIYPNPALTTDAINLAAKTIKRLDLDCPENREMRAKHYKFYAHEDWSGDYLHQASPFVWDEIVRQGLRLPNS